tara:strand:+ start:1232 stop:1987 length:756 start_codon:yes stop_codon:yes gene_type:complete
MSNFLLSIILPVKNESDIIEQSITSFHKEIKEKLNSTEFEFVIVLNGCTDNSEIKINNLKEQFNINVVKLRKSNYGLALKTGILNSSSNYILILNADIVWDKKFFNWAWENKNRYAIILGSKRADPTLNFQPSYRKLLSKGLNSILNVLFDSVVMDTHGIKLIDIKKTSEIIKNSQMTRGQFDTEFTLKSLKAGLDIVEVPVIYKESRKPRNLMITKIVQNIFDLFFLYRIMKKIKYSSNIRYRRLSREDI